MKYGQALMVILLASLALTVGCNSMQTASAILRYQQGEYDMADSLAREALKINPNDGEAYFYMALSESKLGEYADAYEHFRKAAELKPERAELAEANIQSNFAVAFNDGVEAFESENNELAIEYFTTATEANPENPLGYTNLAKAYWAKAERFKDVDREEYLELANRALENFETGLEKETEAEKREATARAATNILGNLFVDDEENREAHLERYRQFTGRPGLEDLYSPHEDFAEVLYEEGAELRDMNRRVAKELDIHAGEAYAKAADIRQRLGETDANIPLLAGISYMNAEMYDQAAHYLELSTQLDPNYDQGWFFLEYSHFNAKDYDEAIKAGRFLAESLESTRPEVFQILAQSYKAKAEACDQAGDSACFEEQKRLYEDAYISFATYRGLSEVAPPPLLSQEEKRIAERRENAIFEKENVAILSASIDGQFVRGTILNKSGEDLIYLEISISLLDEAGLEVGETMGIVDGLAADEEKRFSAAFITSGVTDAEITDIYME